MAKPKIAGYVVKNNNGQYLEYSNQGVTLTRDKPEHISKATAYRRLASFLEENPWAEEHGGFYVEPVLCEPTPRERMVSNAADLLQKLLTEHGVDLGITRPQLEAAIDNELSLFVRTAKTFPSRE